MTAAKLKDIGTRDVVPEWDASFGSEKQIVIGNVADGEKGNEGEAAQTPLETEPGTRVELDLLSVRPSMSCL